MVVVWIEAFLLGYTDIFHNKQTETITLFQANKSDSLHFFPTNITHYHTLFQENRMRILQEFSDSMTDFLLSSTLLERKTYRKPQKSKENHYLCIQ